jgi:hypothetical protein
MLHAAFLRRPLRAVLLVASLLAAAACTSEEGVTPTCAQDMTANGHVKTDGGCNPFAVCVIDGKVSSPSQCCAPFKDNQYDYAACLYGYGEGNLGNGTGGAGGSNGTGSGGAGGGN